MGKKKDRIEFLERENFALKNLVKGRITTGGQCFILNTVSLVEIYNKWVDSGSKCSDKLIKWRGGEVSFKGGNFTPGGDR